jgi:hypothetical protein
VVVGGGVFRVGVPEPQEVEQGLLPAEGRPAVGPGAHVRAEIVLAANVHVDPRIEGEMFHSFFTHNNSSNELLKNSIAV